jgi:hypothetical protein
VGGFLIGKSGGSYEQKRLALIGGKLGEGNTEVLEIEMHTLLGLNLQATGEGAIGILDLAAALSVFGMEEITQDREEPSVQIRARFETMKVGQGSQQCVLDEIVGPVDLSRKRNGKGA